MNQVNPNLSPEWETPPSLRRVCGSTLAGEVRRPGMVYRVRLAWEDGTLSGRLGGSLFGENVHLEAQRDTILGTAASSSRVLALHGRQAGQELEYRLVGAAGCTARLEIHSGGWIGRVYSLDRSLLFRLEYARGLARAHLGLEDQAQEILLRASELPPLVLGAALLLADVAARQAWQALLSSYQGIAEG